MNIASILRRPLVLSGVAALSCIGLVPAASAQGPCGGGTVPAHLSTMQTGGPVDLSGHTLVLDETFSGPLRRYDGRSGIWSTNVRRDHLVTNGPQSVFLDEGTPLPDGRTVDINPFSVEDGILHIGAGVIPEETLPDVQEALRFSGQHWFADNARYYTGRISTYATWGQTYGYFEIRAKIPEGKGHWPAFWLAPAGIGWPPELDIFEAYGRGLDRPTGADNTFHMAVFFDDIDIHGRVSHAIDVVNPFHTEDGAPQQPQHRDKHEGNKCRLGIKIHADEHGADIYDDFHVYAAKWTPETIIYYFGKDHASLKEVFRVPTPDDLHDNMFLIVNDQISSRFGWNPVEGIDHLTFAPDNTFQIDYVKIYAREPGAVLRSDADGAAFVAEDGDARVMGTAGDDRITLRDGEHHVTLGGGADLVFVRRGLGNKLIEGFGDDDRVVLEGFFFDGVDDALARLTQVGEDVWLANGADPANPQTVVFRGTTVDAITADNLVVRWSVTPNHWTSGTKDAERRDDANSDGIVEADARGSRMADVSPVRRRTHMVGSAAPDEYFVYERNTTFEEPASGGVDTIFAYRNITMPDHVENIVARSAVPMVRLYGNDSGNRMIGNDLGQSFQGRGGDDLIVTGGGRDDIVFAIGDGHDVVRGFDEDDFITLGRLSLPSAEAALSRLVTVDNHTVLTLDENTSMLFEDTPRDVFTADSFSFVRGANTLDGEAPLPPLIAPTRPSGDVERVSALGAAQN